MKFGFPTSVLDRYTVRLWHKEKFCSINITLKRNSFRSKIWLIFIALRTTEATVFGFYSFTFIPFSIYSPSSTVFVRLLLPFSQRYLLPRTPNNTSNGMIFHFYYFYCSVFIDKGCTSDGFDFCPLNVNTKTI